LSKFGIEIPDEAVFITDTEGFYTFSVEMAKLNESIVDGNIICRLYNDDTIKEINNQLINILPIKNIKQSANMKPLKKLKMDSLIISMGKYMKLVLKILI